EDCSPDYRCVPTPSGTCTSNDECGDLVCLDGQCGPCSLGGVQCGADERCAPTGRCVEGAASSGAGGPGEPDLEAGDAVQGGACACTAGPAPFGGGALSLLAVGGLALAFRRRPRRGAGADR
ncbi:MAG TPA: MYXO-CTERM sorting domain-containing protein, partial [Sorangium sp.]|nr:MYXO-CTERM sorting domain-containing protein [Sorangium sp.]